MSVTAGAAEPLVWARRHDSGRSTVLSLCGEYDLATRGQLQVALAHALSGGVEDVLILDLSRLDFCDVGCARLICDASRAGHVVVTGMSATLGRMLDLLDPDLRLARSGAAHDNVHLIPRQRRGLGTSTALSNPSRDTDGARPEESR